MTAELPVLLEDFDVELEGDYEVSLRPQTLDDFVGQESLVKRLRTRVGAVKRRGGSLEHMLFTGGPGLGKTSLALLMANELGVNMLEATGDKLKHSGDIYAILKRLEPGDILFIDEIHMLPRPVADAMLPCMEDFKISLVLGRGPSAEIQTKQVPRFTLIGATTEAGKLKKPFRDRFAFKGRLAPYSVAELKDIIVRSAEVKGIYIEESAAEMVAERSRCTPRIANTFLSGLKDFAIVHCGGNKEITEATTAGFFELEGIDSLGLEERERDYLQVLCERFSGSYVGVKNVAAVLGEDEESLVELEEWLIHEQLVIKNKNGRTATPKGYLHLKMRPPWMPKGYELNPDKHL